MPADLIGRDDELWSIDEFLHEDGAGAVALVLAGEQGIGKTLLWQAGIDRARASLGRVLMHRGIEAEAGFAFSGLADLVSDILADTLPSIPAPQRRALEVALLLTEPGDDAEDPHAAALGFLNVLRVLGESGRILIAVDDIQWLDTSSAAVLQFALRRLRTERVALLATLRVDGGRTASLDVERALPHGGFRQLVLEPLSVGALHHVLKARLGLELGRSELVRLHATAGGNPFFALELGRELLRSTGNAPPPVSFPMPQTLKELVGVRLARLSPRAREVLAATAASARPSVEVLSSVYGEQRVVDALDEAVRAGVVQLEEARVRFSHPLLGSVCYTEAPVWTRRAVHKALAAAVEDIEERARHLAFATARPDPGVAVELAAAADKAAARGATAAAAELFELAAEATPSSARDEQRSRRLRAANFHRLAGDRARAAAILEKLLPEARPGAERADVLFALASTRHGSLPALAATCEEALAELVEDYERAAAISILLSWIRLSQGDVRAALGVARAGLEHAERTGDSVLIARAIGRVSMAETWAADVTPGLIERGVELEERFGRFLEFAESPTVALERRLICQGEFQRARPLLERIVASAADHGDEGTRGYALVHFALLEWCTGRWQAALEDLDAALELAEQIGDGQFLGFVLDAKALVELYLGRVEEVREAVERSDAAAAAASDMLVGLWNRAIRGATELAVDNVAAAADHLRELPARFLELGWWDTADHIWPDTIEVLIALGELERARRYLDEFEAGAARLESRWALASVDCCRGLLLAAEGDLEAAFAAFDRALSAQERLPAPFELARTLLALGSVRRRARQKRPAREALERALAIFEELGARLWVEKTRRELARISGRRGGSTELTETEERVAALAAGGSSNKEIAASLYMSVHTVEAHLSRVYRKLGIRSRAELAGRVPAKV